MPGGMYLSARSPLPTPMRGYWLPESEYSTPWPVHRRCSISERRRTTRTSAVWHRSTWRRPGTVWPARTASRCYCSTGPTSASSTTTGTPSCIRSVCLSVISHGRD